jgi:hypothetical protein
MVGVAFGKGFFGNYISLVTPKRSYKVKADGLDIIAKKIWPYIPRLSERYEVAGEFTSEDGSSLKVNLEYKNGAERYAEIYKKHLGKDVSIQVKV